MATRAPSPRLRGREVELRARGLEVVSGRAQELERTRPFGVLASMFAGFRSSPEARRRAIATLLATHLGDGGPVTVSSDPGLQFQAVDAEGLANPQIGEHLYVSRRTVQTHLAHVFTKLGISSRAQLAAEATRRRGEA
jgi:Bacterial regulatory proteins, luxR family